MMPRISGRIMVAALTLASASFAFQGGDRVNFSDVAIGAGITFHHENGDTSEKYLPETMTGGAVIFDYDNDNWPDLFFVNGGSLTDVQVAAGARHRLYRNNHSGRFTDVTSSSGIGVAGYGMGACSADYDNDGAADLYITAVGANKLYHNTGNNGFTDVTDVAGVAGGMWSVSCAFADIDNDGDADLYVTRYVDFTVSNNKICTMMGHRAYCHPDVYHGVPDILYRNNGDGTFTDATLPAGVDKIGNGLGVVFGDYDGDGWSDIYVANDSTPNFLYHNLGRGVFEEVGLWTGVAVGTDGLALAGMGTDIGDFDGDEMPDLVVTNLNGQTHNVYRNLGDGLFSDVTFLSGVGEATLPYVGFGTAFLDYDNDGDLDLAIANGDVIDNVHLLRDNTGYEQLNLLLENDGKGRFRNAGPDTGPGFAIKKPSRALVTGDLDNDGDVDIVISNVGQTPDVLRNDGGNRGNSILVRTLGSASNRDGLGARLRLFVGTQVLLREVRAGSSYLGQSDVRVHFGMGRSNRADRLEVRWPSGTVDVMEHVQANRILTVKEGMGIVSSSEFDER